MPKAFRLATKEDDRLLLDLFTASQMSDEGLFSLQYGREPSFFHGLDVEGSFRQTGISVNDEGTMGTACFTRTVRQLWVNKKHTNLGYIANCRIHPQYRSSTLLFKGYSLLKELHSDGRSPLYLSTILEGNDDARNILTSNRAGLPAYHEIGRYTCHAIVAGQDVKPVSNCEIVKGTPELLPQIVACLNRLGERRQFAPVFTVEDFSAENSLTRDLALNDFFVAKKDDRVVGVMAAWNQLSFKQLTVARYGFLMKCVKGFWNAIMPSLGYGALPCEGESFPIHFISMVSVDEDNPDVFRDLLSALIKEVRARGCLFAILGLCDKDPLTLALSGYLKFGYRSRIYIVVHKGDEAEFEALDSGIPWLDAGMI